MRDTGPGSDYPGDIEVRHQLLEGPGLLCLLLVVQRDLLAELPGVGATCARGAGHGAGRGGVLGGKLRRRKWKAAPGVYLSPWGSGAVRGLKTQSMLRCWFPLLTRGAP